MKCVLKGVAAFVACGLLALLLLPAISSRGSYAPKKLPVKVRVIDTDEHAPVSGAQVTFFRGRDTSLVDAEPQMDDFAKSGLSSATTDTDGYAEVMGTFRASANRRRNLTDGLAPKYRLGGGWLKVVAEGRPTVFVAVDGHGFGGERDYENNQPLEVIVISNKAPAPQHEMIP